LELRNTLTGNVVVNGGVIQNTLGTLYGYASGTLDGEVTMNSDVRLRTANNTTVWVTLTGTLNDGANSYKVLRDSGNSEVRLNGPGLYDGGTDITQGRLVINHVDALGTGSVYVGRNLGTGDNQGGGSLLTRVDGSLNGLPSVIVDAGARYEVDSDETTLVTIKTGGALVRNGGTRNFIYSGTGQNIDLERGAIVDKSVVALPTNAEVTALASGDAFWGVYKGERGWSGSALSGNYVVGDDGSTSIYRGFAALNAVTWRPQVSITGTVDEHPNSNQGIFLYAQTGGEIRLEGSPNFNPNAANGKVYMGGDGNLRIESGANIGGSYTTIEKYGTGLVEVRGASGITGKTLNVHEGRLAVRNATALAGSTVTVGSGAIFGVAVAQTDMGDVTIKGGGVLWPYVLTSWQYHDYDSRIPFDNAGVMAQVTMEEGSQFQLRTWGNVWSGGTAEVLPGS
ncbi:hypothetical protein LCGC14_2646040, partial [marine sediment metagenome]